jgi:hypothetical protein
LVREQQRTTNPEFRSNLLTKIEQLRLAPNAWGIELLAEPAQGNMPHPRVEEWLDAMRSTRAKHEQAWIDICAHAPELNRDEFSELVRTLETEDAESARGPDKMT